MWKFLIDNIGVVGAYLAGIVTVSIPYLLTSHKEKKLDKKNNYKELTRLRTKYQQDLSNLIGLAGQSESIRHNYYKTPSDQLMKEVKLSMESQTEATGKAVETKSKINAELADSRILFKLNSNEKQIAANIEQWTHISAISAVEKYFAVLMEQKGDLPRKVPKSPRDFISDIDQLLKEYINIIEIKL